MALEERTPLTQLPGIGPAKGRALARLGLERLGDLLEHFPQRYEDRRRCWTIRQAPLEQPCCVSALVAESPPPGPDPERAGAGGRSERWITRGCSI